MGGGYLAETGGCVLSWRKIRGWGKRTGLVPGELSLLRTASVQQTGWKPAKNLLRAAELALQFDMQEKAEQYLNEAAEIPGMEEDIFYQQIRKRWEEAG